MLVGYRTPKASGNAGLGSNSAQARASELSDAYTIRTPEQLAGLLGSVAQASIEKEVEFIHAEYRALIEAVFLQCARAIQRSALWQPSASGSSSKVPSPGKILEALTNAAIDGEKYDRELPQRQRDTLY